MDIMLKRIVELIGEKHGAKKELAEGLGISQNVFTAWFAGKSKSYAKYAPQIADHYNVSLDWLSGKTDIKKPATNSGDGFPSNLIPYQSTGSIPILGQIPAGLAVLAVEDIEGYLAVNVNNPEECFALRVKGDSMINAGITPGDLVVIRMQQCAENGQIVACRVNGDEATLKRFKQHGDTVILLPENPNYDPIIVPCSDFANGYASIIGVALQVVRML